MARTDDDTWDLATSVGATATMVAAARAIATKVDDPLSMIRSQNPSFVPSGSTSSPGWPAVNSTQQMSTATTRAGVFG